jgi:adenine-specific DNA-methyltransferase
MATGVPKTKWKLHHVRSSRTEEVVLSYSGKKHEETVMRTVPAKLKLLWDGPGTNGSSPRNRLYYGDNLPVMASLLPQFQGKVRLVYIDPPYGTKSIFQSRSSQADAYVDLLSGSHYVEFIRERLVLLRELLAEDGSIYIHLDDKMVFHIKLVMDEVFGKENFRNCIVRKKCSSKNFTKNTFGNVADYILFYSKSDEYVWNRQFEEWTPEKALKEYEFVEAKTGRRYKRVPIHAPGTRNGETGKEWRNMKPPPGKHWQFPPAVLEEMDARGEIYWSSNGNPRRKIYFDKSNGISIQDIWTEFRDAHNQNIMITGYPTEKNAEMMRRIIRASSNEGDIVMDIFAGSGTTLSVSHEEKRKWIGVDNSQEALTTILKRFAVGSKPMGDYVGKRGKKKRSEPTLFTEASLAASHNKTISDFSLYAEEILAADILPILQHYPAK